jgi:histidine triad (HIT) family protein
MWLHEPTDYSCPLCRVAAGAERAAIVHADDRVVVAIALHQKATNHGGLLVFPRAHVENIYAVSPTDLGVVFGVAQRVATALKRALSADGVTVIQNNEPASGQDVWHFHVHVVPRFVGDSFRSSPWEVVEMEARSRLADKIRNALAAADAGIDTKGTYPVT